MNWISKPGGLRLRIKRSQSCLGKVGSSMCLEGNHWKRKKKSLEIEVGTRQWALGRGCIGREGGHRYRGGQSLGVIERKCTPEPTRPGVNLVYLIHIFGTLRNCRSAWRA